LFNRIDEGRVIDICNGELGEYSGCQSRGTEAAYNHNHHNGKISEGHLESSFFAKPQFPRYGMDG
jgi:hypothetical protein